MICARCGRIATRGQLYWRSRKGERHNLTLDGLLRVHSGGDLDRPPPGGPDGTRYEAGDGTVLGVEPITMTDGELVCSAHLSI
jgi:hypothetical protein